MVEVEQGEGKVALVTGATRGIGRSIAEHLAASGWSVIATGRTAEKGQKVVDNIRAAGGEASFLALDVNSEESVREVVEATVERYGKLTTLVNNAAPTQTITSAAKGLADCSTEEWDAIVRGTLTSAFWTTKYSWNHLAAAEGASIVNISSGQAVAGFRGFGAYGASKAGVDSLTRTAAVEGAPVGIRANSIRVGRVVALRGDYGGHYEGALTRVGNPMDVAYAVEYLASDRAEYVTGSTLTADGGFSINGDAAAGSA